MLRTTRDCESLNGMVLVGEVDEEVMVVDFRTVLLSKSC